MKKTYINPEMEVVELKMNCTLLAESQMGIGNPTDKMDAPEFDFEDF